MTTATDHRSDYVQRYADLIRTGSVSRDATIGFRPLDANGFTDMAAPSEDITAEVHAAAGELSGAEAVARVEYLERTAADRIAGDIQTHVFDEWCMDYRHRYDQDDFEIEEAEDDDGPIILVRKRDGRRFEVEIDVRVRSAS